MPSFGEIFGSGSVANQLLTWQVLAQIVSTLGSPFFTELQKLANSRTPVVDITAGQAAEAGVRGFITRETAEQIARNSGINTEQFDVLWRLAQQYPSPADAALAVVRTFWTEDQAREILQLNGLDPKYVDLLKYLAAEPIPPEAAAEALRRGIIPEDGPAGQPSYMAAIREGRIGNQWADVIKKLATQWPTAADILEAYLEGQIETRDEAIAKYQQVGGDPQWFDLLFNTRGSAPTPLEAAQMANRGIIPWTRQKDPAEDVSFEQAFLEGPWRNKWLEPYRQLAVYIPPPRTITTLIHDGVITDEQALQWYKATGMTDETAAAYVASAHVSKTAANRDLTVSQLIQLYEAQIIPRDKVVESIQHLGYDAQESEYIVELADVRFSLRAINAAVSKIQTLYVGHKISRAVAQAVMSQLGLPGDQVTNILAVWDLEAAANVRQLTPAQIVDAFHYGIIDQAEAQAELESIGYLPHDAWLLLSIKEKQALPNEPPRDSVGQLGG